MNMTYFCHQLLQKCTTVFILLTIIIGTCIGLDPCSINVTVNLNRYAKYRGFRRDIITECGLNLPDELTKFSLLLIEHLPADLYVDPNELNRLADFGGSQTLLFDKVNIEAPTHKSVPIDMYMFLNSEDALMKSVLPVHLRYQKAHNCTEDGHFVEVHVSLPRIYVRFNHIDLDSCEKSIEAPCGVNEGNCSWIPTTITSDAKELLFAIPVGCTEKETLVTIITFLVIAIAVAIITHVLSKKMENEKIE